MIVPDSDVWTRPDLAAAGLRARQGAGGARREGRRAEAPAGPGRHQGRPRRLPLRARARGVRRAAAARAQARGLQPRRAPGGAAGSSGKEEADDAGAEATALDLLERAESVRVLHPAQDVVDGVLWYGVPVDGALVAITSARQAYRADRLPEGIALRHTDPGPSTVSRDLAVLWLTAGESGSIARTLDALAEFFLRYVVLPDRRTALLGRRLGARRPGAIARSASSRTSRSARRRSGAARAGCSGSWPRVCFNASPVTAHPTEAQLYRSAARTGGAQLFDEVETLRGDKDRFDALITRAQRRLRARRRGDAPGEARRALRGGAVRGVRAAGAGGHRGAQGHARGPGAAAVHAAQAPERAGRAPERRDRRGGAGAARRVRARVSHADRATSCARTTTPRRVLEREGIDDRAVDLWSPAGRGDGRGRRARTTATGRASCSTWRASSARCGRPTPRPGRRPGWWRRSTRSGPGPARRSRRPISWRRSGPGRGGSWVKSTRRLAGLLNPLGHHPASALERQAAAVVLRARRRAAAGPPGAVRRESPSRRPTPPRAGLHEGTVSSFPASKPVKR